MGNPLGLEGNTIIYVAAEMNFVPHKIGYEYWYSFFTTVASFDSFTSLYWIQNKYSKMYYIKLLARYWFRFLIFRQHHHQLAMVTFKPCVALFAALLPGALASIYTISDERIRDIDITPVLGRGYSIMTNSYQSTCLMVDQVTVPSFNYNCECILFDMYWFRM